MKRLMVGALCVVGAVFAGCNTEYVGGCRLPDDTCLEFYTDNSSTDTTGPSATCRAAGGGDFSSASCSSSSRVGTCLFESLLTGRRQIYYSPTWTTESARINCDAARGSSGSFITN